MTSARCLLVAALALLGGCFTPPALLPAGLDVLDLGQFPPGTERVELDVGSGETIRGVFVPADPGAPVVVHFLESRGSITYGSVEEGFVRDYTFVWQVRDLGFASLVVDYRGIGTSDGDRHPHHIRQDALTTWREALRRVGGNEKMVVVRGTSIGTLAAASLLDSGAAPRAVVLYSPVLAETVAVNYAYHHYADVPVFLIARFLTNVADVNLREALAGVRSPLLVVAPTEDYMVTPEERASIQAATRKGGGTWVDDVGDHIDTSLKSRMLPEPERAFYRRDWLRPAVAGARTEAVMAVVDESQRSGAMRRRVARVVRDVFPDPPAMAAGLARASLSDLDLEGARRQWLRWLVHRRAAAPLPVGAWAALLSLENPGGGIPIEAVDEMLGAAQDNGAMWTASQCVDFVRRFGFGDETIDLKEEYDGPFVPFLLRDAVQSVARQWMKNRKSGTAAAQRMGLRAVFKAAGVPDRIRRVEGKEVHEVWEDGGWKPLIGGG